MDQRLLLVRKKFGKPSLPPIRVGETIRVHQKIREGDKDRISLFEGIVIARKHGEELGATFTVRRIAAGIGVERIFPLHHPAIVKIERRKVAPVRRAKLYYLRGLFGRKLKKRGERRMSELWEDPAVKEELERIAAEKALAAKTKAEADQEAEAALKEKAESALAARQSDQAAPSSNE